MFRYSGFAYLAALVFLGAAVVTIFRLDLNEGSIVVPNRATLDDALKAGDTVAAGFVLDQRGGVIEHPRVWVQVFGEQNKKLFDRELQCTGGMFVIRKQDLPKQPELYGISVRSEASFYLAGSTDHTVRVTNGQDPVTDQRELRIRQTYINPRLTVLLLIPAIFGLLFSILHITQLEPSLRFTAVYSAGTAGLWSVVTWRFVRHYADSGDAQIALLWPDLYGPIGSVVFTFLGTLTYAAYSLGAKPPRFHQEAPEMARQKLLLALGGRILIAPYIALVTISVFSSALPNYATGPIASFLSFFTGLYIPVVLRRLNSLGVSLLSTEQQARVVEKATKVIDSASEAKDQPSTGLAAAVNEARRRLVDEHKTVIGVQAGPKLAGGNLTGDQSVVVYVTAKQENPEKPIPKIIGGFPTDVQVLPDAPPDAVCHGPMFSVAWDKVNLLRTETAKLAAAPDVRLDSSKRVVLVADGTRSLLLGAAERFELLDVIGAWKLVHGILLDRHDFVAFLLDVESGYKDRNNYYAPVFNDVHGVNFPRGDNGGAFDKRVAWGNPQRLRGCQVHNFFRSATRPVTHRTLLHEIGHCWGMYLDFPGLASGDGPHWSPRADNGRSCMDYDEKQWVPNADGTFTLKPVDEEEFNYCPLDLYLMGFAPALDVTPVKVFPERALAATGPVSDQPAAVTLADIRAKYGRRSPDSLSSPKEYRQAFVVISSDMASAEQCAQVIRQKEILEKHEVMFARATGVAKLVTQL